ADTTECYAPGPTDFELYLAFEGAGRATAEQTLGQQLVLGYGLTERLSGYFSTTLTADGNLVHPETETAAGLYGTPLDSDHLDLDVFLGFGVQGGDRFTAGPGLELNWDAAPDLDAWGLYVRSGLAVSGHETDAGFGRTTDLELTLGCYWTVAPGRQFLLEFDGCTEDQESHLHGTEKEWSIGGWALGFNASLNRTMELITQVYLDVPDDGEDYGLGAMVGFIATMSTD
ncbi:MAG: hypothetical protein DRJ61_15205, partial [Acidobacteria bacterium]